MVSLSTVVHGASSSSTSRRYRRLRRRRLLQAHIHMLHVDVRHDAS